MDIKVKTELSDKIKDLCQRGLLSPKRMSWTYRQILKDVFDGDDNILMNHFDNIDQVAPNSPAWTKRKIKETGDATPLKYKNNSMLEGAYNAKSKYRKNAISTKKMTMRISYNGDNMTKTESGTPVSAILQKGTLGGFTDKQGNQTMSKKEAGKLSKLTYVKSLMDTSKKVTRKRAKALEQHASKLSRHMGDLVAYEQNKAAVDAFSKNKNLERVSEKPRPIMYLEVQDDEKVLKSFSDALDRLIKKINKR